MIDVFSVISMDRCEISIFDWVPSSAGLQAPGDHDQIVVGGVGLSQHAAG